jgi:methyl-accepting chemotaxis protein
MKLSIRKKILLVVANALVLMVAFAAIVNWQFSGINANKKTIVLMSEALRDHMHGDMMHDALRGDVLAAIHAAANKNPAGVTSAAKEAAEHADEFRASVKANHDRPLTRDVATALNAVDKPLNDYIASAENIVALAATDYAAADAAWPAFESSFTKLEVAMVEAGDKVEASVKTVSEASNNLGMHFRITVVVALLLSVISLSLLSWFITRSIVTALDRVGGKLKEGSNQLNLSANEVSNSSKTLAESASQQAASLEETSASLEEIAAMTKRNADSAGSGARLGTQTREAAASGMTKLSELTQSLNSIKSAVGEMQTAVHEMQSSSQQVAKIIKTIDEIAFQTNLLALNAAVEAARAGEAGMGFAVVADEVRALAQRSAQAAKDTSEKIEGAVKRSEFGAAASSKVVKSLAEVEVTAETIQQVFSGIVGQIKALDEVVSQIAAASQEQTAGLNEVNMAVSQLDKVTQSNAAGAEENASSSAVMNSESANLLNAVHELHAIVTGETHSSSHSPLPNDRDNAAFAFSAKPKATKAKTVSAHEFQNF